MALALNLQPYPLFVLVGMGAMMAGVSKTPIAAAVLVTEMVGGFVVLIPLMVASTVSYLVTGKYTLYESQVTSSRIGVDFSTLGEVRIKDVVSRNPISVDINATPSELSKLILEHPHHLYPVVQDGRVIGIVTKESIPSTQDQGFTIEEIVQREFHFIKETCSAADAFELMTSQKVSTIVVVDSEETRRLVGLVTRIDIFNTMEHMDETHHAY